MKIPELDVEDAVKDYINKVVNIDRRSIIITGGIRTGKTLLLNYLQSINKYNTTLVDMWRDNAEIVTLDAVVNDSIQSLVSEKITFMADEVHPDKQCNNILLGEYTHVYENYVIVIHSRDRFDHKEVMNRLGRVVSMEFVDYMKPIVIHMGRVERASSKFKASILDIYDNTSLYGIIEIKKEE